MRSWGSKLHPPQSLMMMLKTTELSATISRNLAGQKISCHKINNKVKKRLFIFCGIYQSIKEEISKRKSWILICDLGSIPPIKMNFEDEMSRFEAEIHGGAAAGRPHPHPQNNIFAPPGQYHHHQQGQAVAAAAAAPAAPPLDTFIQDQIHARAGTVQHCRQCEKVVAWHPPKSLPSCSMLGQTDRQTDRLALNLTRIRA